MTSISKNTAAKITTPPPPPPTSDHPLHNHVATMQSLVERYELVVSLFAFASVWTAVLLVFTVIDSWVVTGGVPVIFRVLIFSSMMIWTVIFAVRRILPLLLWQITPAYAAMQIDEAQPKLKNAVLNWLLLWQEQRVSAALRRDTRMSLVWQALGAQATQAIRPDAPRAWEQLYYRYLVAAMTVFAVTLIYTLVSPKSPFPSVARLLVPFANFLPPQRLYLEITAPGNAVCFQGGHVAIKVKLSRDPGEIPVYVVYSTNDGRYIQQRVPMVRADAVMFAREFPPSRAGLESSLAYWVECGDSRSDTFQIDVREQFTILADNVRLEYPAYTGLEPGTRDGSGDIEAIEGTKVTLTARANSPMKTAWWIQNDTDLGDGNKQLMRVDADAHRAIYQWTLKLADETEYHLTAEDNDNNKSQKPTNYRVVTIADEKPTIAWELSGEANTNGEIALPLGSTFEAMLVAQDPDFALRYVRLYIQRVEPNTTNNKSSVNELLDSPSDGATKHTGAQKCSVIVDSRKRGMRENELYEVWGEALDTKLPEANATKSDTLRIRITAQQQQEQQQQQQQQEQEQQTQQENQEQNDQQQQQQDNQQGGENKNGEQQTDEQENQPSEQQGDEQGNESGSESNSENSSNNGGEDGEPSEEVSEGGEKSESPRTDPETQPGDAFDKVLEHLKSQKGKPAESEPNRPPDETQQRDDLDPNGQKEPGEPKTGEPKQTSESQGNSQSNSKGESQSKSPSSEQDNSQDKPSGENKPGEQSGDKPGQGGGGERGEAGNTGDEPPPPQADDPNLEFTKRETSLALDYLEKQLAAKEPDPELLKSLGWSREDLAKFVANWKKMQQAAETGGEKSRGDYNELLRSLGIRPAQAASRTRHGHSTVSERTTETQSRRIDPPAILRDRFKNYTERIGQ